VLLEGEEAVVEVVEIQPLVVEEVEEVMLVLLQ
jgi:hypothetical protein